MNDAIDEEQIKQSIKIGSNFVKKKSSSLLREELIV